MTNKDARGHVYVFVRLYIDLNRLYSNNDKINFVANNKSSRGRSFTKMSDAKSIVGIPTVSALRDTRCCFGHPSAPSPMLMCKSSVLKCIVVEPYNPYNEPSVNRVKKRIKLFLRRKERKKTSLHRRLTRNIDHALSLTLRNAALQTTRLRRKPVAPVRVIFK